MAETPRLRLPTAEDYAQTPQKEVAQSYGLVQTPDQLRESATPRAKTSVPKDQIANVIGRHASLRQQAVAAAMKRQQDEAEERKRQAEDRNRRTAVEARQYPLPFGPTGIAGYLAHKGATEGAVPVAQDVGGILAGEVMNLTPLDKPDDALTAATGVLEGDRAKAAAGTLGFMPLPPGGETAGGYMLEETQRQMQRAAEAEKRRKLFESLGPTAELDASLTQDPDRFKGAS